MRSWVVVLLCMAACGSSNSPADPEPPEGPNVLTPAGGTITLANGAVTVIAPAGAVTRNVALSAALSASGIPTDAALVQGSAYTVSAAPATTLLKPLQVTLRYDPAQGPGGVPAHHYGLATVTSGAWSALGNTVADTAANTASADITAFGIIGVRRVSPATPCTAAEYRQFDFWLGTWNVNTIDSDITGEPSGCAIFEHYKAPTPGLSISVYDPRTQMWYQTYHPGVAAPYVMSGGLVDGRMVMYVRSAGGQLQQRWTWERNADGTVTQSSANTSNNGASWQAGFSGVYRKR